MRPMNNLVPVEMLLGKRFDLFNTKFQSHWNQSDLHSKSIDCFLCEWTIDLKKMCQKPANIYLLKAANRNTI